MLAMREKELNMVNGGTVFGTVFGELFGGPKFSVGDRVISISDPDMGVGVVSGMDYNEGWFYSVATDRGMYHTSEADLESPIMK